MTDRDLLNEIADELDGAIRVFAGMCAVYPMPKKTEQAMLAFIECLGKIAAKATRA